jgi:hypothetical protein
MLADVTPSNIKGYLSLHAMPPKLFLQVLVHFGALLLGDGARKLAGGV